MDRGRTVKKPRRSGLRDRGRPAAAAGLLLLLIDLSGCTAPGPPQDLPAEQQLDQLVVTARPAPDPSYRRAAFGPAWADVDRDGCNTRDQVLYATVDKSRPVQVRRQGRCATDMVAGTWIDLYTNQEMVWTNLKDPTQAQALPLDHVVSLAEVWRDGARDWTAEQRLQFANDPINLQPTTTATNRAKSDHDPATWTPPKAGRCGYATRYIATKTRYRLPVDPLEQDALRKLLRTCP